MNLTVSNISVPFSGILGSLNFINEDYKFLLSGYMPASVFVKLANPLSQGELHFSVGTDVNGTPMSRGYFDVSGMFHLNSGMRFDTFSSGYLKTNSIGEVSIDSDIDPDIHHNDLSGLQGGVPDEYYHLNETDYNSIVSGTMSGDYIARDLALSGTLQTTINNTSGTLVTHFHSDITTVSGTLVTGYNAADAALSGILDTRLYNASGLFLKADGTTPLTADWDAGVHRISASSFFAEGIYALSGCITLLDSITALSGIIGVSYIESIGPLYYNGLQGITQLLGDRRDTQWNSGYLHIANNGTDHSYINQAVLTTSTPQFTRLGIGAAADYQAGLDVRTARSYFGAVQGYTYIDNDGINFAYNTSGNWAGGINYAGYLNGATQFRDLIIYNGKNTAVVTVDGSAGAVILGTPQYANPHVSGALWCSGQQMMMSVG